MSDIWRVNNSTLLGGEVCAQWQAGHAYSVGARCVCRLAYTEQDRRKYVYECTTGGTSHGSTEPTWPTSGTVADNDVVWTTRSPNDGTWNNASCHLEYVLNRAAASGDTVYVDDGHSEIYAPGEYNSLTMKGCLTDGLSNYVLCVDKADDSLSSGAIITIQSANVNFSFSYVGYAYGITLRGNASTVKYDMQGRWILENCILDCDGSGSKIIGSSSGAMILKDCDIDPANTNFVIYAGAFRFVWLGGALLNPVTALLVATYSGSPFITTVRDVDLSALGNNTIVDCGNSGWADWNMFIINFERCKLPASCTLTNAATKHLMGNINFSQCSASNIVYDFHNRQSTGYCAHETTIIRTGGASDGTTGHSIKMVTGSNSIERIFTLESPPIVLWNTATTESDFTIELVYDSATALQNDEIHMELEYPVDDSSGLGGIESSGVLVLGTAADIPDSSETWTTTGLTNPNTRKLTVTVTPGKAGPVTARVYLGKASTTVYVDPIITVS